jgi:hypothetical protein
VPRFHAHRLRIPALEAPSQRAPLPGLHYDPPTPCPLRTLLARATLSLRLTHSSRGSTHWSSVDLAHLRRARTPDIGASVASAGWAFIARPLGPHSSHRRSSYSRDPARSVGPRTPLRVARSCHPRTRSDVRSEQHNGLSPLQWRRRSRSGVVMDRYGPIVMARFDDDPARGRRCPRV